MADRWVQDWYNRHVNNQPQAPVYQPQAYAPPPVPQGYQPPPGYQLVPTTAPARQPMPWETWGGRRDPWAPEPPAVDTSSIPRGYVTPENFLTMAQYWRGGKGKQ